MDEALLIMKSKNNKWTVPDLTLSYPKFDIKR